MLEDFRDILELGLRAVRDLEIEVYSVLGKVVGIEIKGIKDWGEIIFEWDSELKSYLYWWALDGAVYEGEIRDVEFWGWFF